jgi:signal transduction histidine kinase/CheY-like chemotaxis protein
VFVFGCVMNLVLLVTVVFGAAFDLFAPAGYAIMLISAVSSTFCMLMLWKTKKVIWAVSYAHFTGVLIGILYPISVPWTTGVGFLDPEGNPKTYNYSVLPIVPAIIAFALRSRRATIGYTVASAVVALTMTFINPQDDDLRGVPTMLATCLIAQVLVGFAFAFFQSVADGLAEESAAAKGKMKMAVREAKAERRANEAKSRFVSVMSHEIRNPLQAILLQLELMEATTLTDVQGDYVAGIMRASNVLLTIVNDILDVTKIESGAIALESIPMSLRDVVEFTLHTNAPAAAKQGVELICNIDPTLNTSVLGDPTRIRQILHNLVSNALKFTPTGEVEVTLTLEDGRVEYGERHVEDGEESETTVKVAPRARSRWRLSVRDTGIGIDEEGKQKLFREFSQVDETTTRMYGGTGLGLFICKELSEIMGGNVSVESEVGVGSTFTATFLTDHADEKDEAPVHIVSSDIRWTAVLYTTNSALTRVLQTYLRYFFSGVREVTFVALDRPKVAEQRIRTLLASSSPTDRLVVLANHSDCTNSLTRMLTSSEGKVGGACVPIVLSDDPVASVRKELEREGWRHVVHKPVSLRQLCSTLDRGISEEQSGGGRVGAAAGAVAGAGFSSEARTLRDGTLTRGQRVPNHTQIAEVSAAHAAANPDASTILIVDDFELVRSLVQQVVQQLGYNTLVAANGKEAADTVRANYSRIAMVLMDCEMPIMDGYEATEAIREFEAEIGVGAGKELFVCAMTANAMREDVKKCYSRKMSGFLAKPVKRSDVEKVLEENARVPTERGATAKRAKKKSRDRKNRDAAAAGASGSDLSSSSSSVASLTSSPARTRTAKKLAAAGPPSLVLATSATTGTASRRKKRGKAGVDVESGSR